MGSGRAHPADGLTPPPWVGGGSDRARQLKVRALYAWRCALDGLMSWPCPLLLVLQRAPEVPNVLRGIGE